MKKSLKALAFAVVATIALASCSTTTPITATSNPVGNKCGEATATKYLGFLFLEGSNDIGINKAAKNAGITKISHVDCAVKDYLIVTKYTTRVYGE